MHQIKTKHFIGKFFVQPIDFQATISSCVIDINPLKGGTFQLYDPRALLKTVKRSKKTKEKYLICICLVTCNGTQENWAVTQSGELNFIALVND